VVATDNFLLFGTTPASGKSTCHQTTHQDYAGVQVGADLGKLNIGKFGANWHFGITAGYLGAEARDTTAEGIHILNPLERFPAGDLKSHFEVPFVGLYSTLTQGNFFADIQARWDFYRSTSSSQTLQFSGIENEATGFSLTGSAGYKIALPSNWFIEPSVGAVWSRVKVDPFNTVNVDAFGNRAGQILEIGDIESILGRASVRLGAHITDGFYSWQPFISASVIHEFAGSMTSKITVAATNFNVAEGPPLITTTERLGTYGQFGIGTAIGFGDTGWLSYGRADIKVGENIQGLNFNVGLRYQW